MMYIDGTKNLYLFETNPIEDFVNQINESDGAI
jgi:hypothetical protein